MTEKRKATLRGNPAMCDCADMEERAFVADLVRATAERLEWELLRREAEREARIRERETRQTSRPPRARRIGIS